MDYVKALGWAKDRDTVMSGGLDSKLVLWDLEALKSSGNAPSMVNIAKDHHSQ